MDLILWLKRTVAKTLSKVYADIHHWDVSVMTIPETINFFSQPGNSMIRFGDGEFSLLNHRALSQYQDSSEELERALGNCLDFRSDKLLICMPETLVSTNICGESSRENWQINFFLNRKQYKRYLDRSYHYGNSFVSRPYMIYRDKSKCKDWFSQLLASFDGRDLLIVEGKLSRSGVGNDLFQRARSVKRILCPPQNAFMRFDEILNASIKYGQGRMILLAVGPTSKPLGVELCKHGLWAVDIGHIDSEYEWFTHGAISKEQISYKHTAEADDFHVGDCTDPEYISSILKEIL